MRKALTDTFLRALKQPAAGRLEYADSSCRGLEFRITQAGARSWSYRYRAPVTGKLSRATIGPYPTISLAAARQRADDLRKGVAGGEKSWKASRPTPHDLRRTFRTRLPQIGVPADIRDRLMNHIPSDVGSKHYDRYQYLDEKRAALLSWQSTLFAIVANDTAGDRAA